LKQIEKSVKSMAAVPESLLFGGIGSLLNATVVPLNRKTDDGDQFIKRATYEVLLFFFC
jgi:hypothetical protein